MTLEEIRREIDAADTALLEAFCRRMELAGNVAAVKKGQNLPLRHPAREREILARVSEDAGEFGAWARVLYSTLIDLSCSYQEQLLTEDGALTREIRRALDETPTLFPTGGTVACQGVEGAYSSEAACRLFPTGDLMFFRSFEHVFDAVESGLCRYGVLPIENSSNGSVSTVYELMKSKRFHIIRSVRLNICHQLLALPGTKLHDIREITSHEQALGQCGAFLKSLPQITVTTSPNTAMAAQRVAESGRHDLAAIASPRCAALYGLVPVADRIQNSENNHTRFICIQKDMHIYPGADRISLMLSAPHRPGGLYELIAKFSALGLNLTKLESRPIPGRDFEFLFYFDFEGSVHSPAVLSLLQNLSRECETFAFLGNYSEQI
ncbi:MAG: bifunctional chorismate mutase/prephenate dehydratase [Ruminococcaceae bacterium]|nr:bifunctional chorismate mutase/prephenate dehydratase [Oscillospiraceae bacterium]